MKWTHTAAAAALMVLGMVFTQYVGGAEDIQPNKPFETFPRRVGDWEGRVDRFEQEIYDILGVDDSFLANYRTPEGRPVQLYIGFYQSQRKGETIHSPKNCMPGAGWKIVETEIIPIRPEGSSEDVRIIRLVLENRGQKQAMLYWFHSRGRVVSSEYWEKIYLVMDSIFRRRTDGSFVRLIAPVSGDDDAPAFRDLKEFAERMMPILNEYIPS